MTWYASEARSDSMPRSCGRRSRPIATRMPSTRTGGWRLRWASTPSPRTYSPGGTSSWERSHTRSSKKSSRRSARRSELPASRQASARQRRPRSASEPRARRRSCRAYRSNAHVLYVWLMNKFFETLGQDWVDAARRRGVAIAKPALDSQIALELLELARVAAHTQERRFAPLTSFLAGVPAERLRAAKPEIAAATLAAFILEVRQKLEREVPGL